MITWVALMAASFAVMEPLTYLAHRFVMHGIGLALHRSHHRRWTRPYDAAAGDSFLEANDAFPVIFAAATITAMTLGLQLPVLAYLLPITVGVTLYGATYAYVHDGYIHGRLPEWLVARNRPRRILDHLAEAHALHHRFGAEPYGMLLPVVPAELRARADRSGERVLPVPGS